MEKSARVQCECVLQCLQPSACSRVRSAHRLRARCVDAPLRCPCFARCVGALRIVLPLVGEQEELRNNLVLLLHNDRLHLQHLLQMLRPILRRRMATTGLPPPA